MPELIFIFLTNPASLLYWFSQSFTIFALINSLFNGEDIYKYGHIKEICKKN